MSYKKKYNFYIVGRGWVNVYDRRRKMAGKRQSFSIDSYENKTAIKLDVEEVLDCINDCNNHEYNNYQFKVYPEDEFLAEYEQYKIKHKDTLTRRYTYVVKNQPLKHPKRINETEFACLQRLTTCDTDLFGSPIEVYWWYSLTTDNYRHTSYVMKYKETQNGFEFETANSIYKAKKILDINYIDQIEELQKYLKSKEYKKFKEQMNEAEQKIYNTLFEKKKKKR